MAETTQPNPAGKLAAHDIHKRYGDDEVIEGVSLDALAGDCLIVVSERFRQFADHRWFLARHARVGSRTPRVTGIRHGGLVAGDGRASIGLPRRPCAAVN